MFGQFYAGMRWSTLPMFALILFLTTFVVVVLRTIFFAHRDEIDRLGHLPLDGDTAEPDGRQS
jgi:hypothetical protein